MSPLVHPALCIVWHCMSCPASVSKQRPRQSVASPEPQSLQQTGRPTGHARMQANTQTQDPMTRAWTLYISRLTLVRVRPHLLTSLPVLVSQPLVLSLGRHVSWALPQKQVLLVWHVPWRLHGSA